MIEFFGRLWVKLFYVSCTIDLFPYITLVLESGIHGYFVDQSLDKCIWFTILFLLSQGELHLLQIFFLSNCHLFCADWSYLGQIYKNVSQVF